MVYRQQHFSSYDKLAWYIAKQFRMRAASVFYLKVALFTAIVLLKSSYFVSGGITDLSVTKTSDTVYKKVLKIRSLPYEDCGSQYEILFLSISSCDQLPCQMPRDSTVTVTVKFNDNGRGTSFLKHNVVWIFNAIKQDGIISPDPCAGDQGCITESFDGKSFIASLDVHKSLPKIPGTMIWGTKDKALNNLICFRVPIVIVS